jgi:4-hydroxy-2-oxoheptanedioate aldolase
MKPNLSKAKLKAGQTVFGTFVRYPDATLIEYLAYLGWDFLIFDGEHGLVEPRDCEQMVRAAEGLDVTPVVRVPTNQAHIILRMMDSGAQGCQVPWVNSGAEAEAAIQAIKYGPRGRRGLAGVVRPADHGQRGTLAEYVQQANQETLSIIQVETATAVDHLEDIVKVPDVDVVFIGPTDLSNSLGLAGQLGHPTVQATIERIFDVVLSNSGTVGIQVPNAETALKWKARGARYITIQLETLLRPGIQAYLGAVRQ